MVAFVGNIAVGSGSVSGRAAATPAPSSALRCGRVSKRWQTRRTALADTQGVSFDPDEGLDSDDFFYIPGKDFEKALESLTDDFDVDPDHAEELGIDVQADEPNSSGTRNAQNRSAPARSGPLHLDDLNLADGDELYYGVGTETSGPDLSPAEQAAKRQREREQTNGGAFAPGKKLAAEEYVSYAHTAQFLPSWVRNAYASDESWKELQDGSDKHGVNRNSKSLVVEAAAQGSETERSSSKNESATLVDCTILELADDYNIPVEYIIDRVAELGVSHPIRPSDQLKDRLTTIEVESILAWLTTFDFQDVYDSYSDRPISEIGSDYSVSDDDLLKLCQRLGIFLAIGLNTRLVYPMEERLIAALEGASPTEIFLQTADPN